MIYLRNFVLNLFHIYFQRLAENVVTKTYHVIFRYGTTVVDVIYVGPQNCPQTHYARLTGSVDVGTRQIKRVKIFAGVPDCFHFAVAGGVVVFCYTVVSFSYDGSVFHDHRTERSAVVLRNALASLVNGNFHIGVHGYPPLSLVATQTKQNAVSGKISAVAEKI